MVVFQSKSFYVAFSRLRDDLSRSGFMITVSSRFKRASNTGDRINFAIAHALFVQTFIPAASLLIFHCKVAGQLANAS